MACGTKFTKGMIIPVDALLPPVVFQWNPATIKYSRAARWHALGAAGNNEPYLQYTCGNNHIVRFTIDVSRENNSDFFVRGFAADLVSLADVSSSGSNIERPPKIVFVSGASLHNFGIIDKVDVDYGLLSNPETLLPYGAKIHVVILRLHPGQS